MSQSDATMASSALSSTFYTEHNNLRDAVRTLWSGTTAPPSPVAGQLWRDTDTPSATRNNISVYDGTDWIVVWIMDVTNNIIELPSGTKFAGGTLTANLDFNTLYKGVNVANGTAAADLVNKGQVDGRIHVAPVALGALAAANVDIPLIAGTSASFVIVGVYLLSNTATATSTGINNWTFQVTNVTAGNNLCSAAKTTNGAEIAANTLYSLGANQNLTIAANDALKLAVTYNGTPTSLASARLTCLVHYKVTT